MQISEKELEDYIFEDLKSDGSTLFNRGLDTPYCSLLNGVGAEGIKATWKRQVNLDPYGVADIIGFYRYSGVIHVEILELKIREVKLEDFEQISRYRRAVERMVANTYPNRKLPIKYHLTIVGTDYEGFYVNNLLPISVAEFTYGLSGIEFIFHTMFSNWYIREDSKRSLKHLLNGQAVH